MYKKIGLVPNVAHGLHRAPSRARASQQSTPSTWSVTSWQNGWCSRTMAKPNSIARSPCFTSSWPSPWLKQASRCVFFLDSAYMLTLFRLELFSFPKIQRLLRFSSYFHGLLEKVAKASLWSHRWFGHRNCRKARTTSSHWWAAHSKSSPSPPTSMTWSKLRCWRFADVLPDRWQVAGARGRCTS